VSKDDPHCRVMVDLVCTWKYLKETEISYEQMSYLKTGMQYLQLYSKLSIP